MNISNEETNTINYVRNTFHFKIFSIWTFDNHLKNNTHCNWDQPYIS